VSDAEQLADRISKALPHVKSGTLRFWGEWFGQPHDNCQTLLRCAAQEDILRLYFNEGETLSVWSPLKLTLDDSTFRISIADRVRWEWFYYGRPKVDSNLYFLDYVRYPKGVTATTNVDWYQPNLKPKGSRPAVEIL
jgi:hypothetical protein